MSAIGTVQNARGAESPYVGLTFYTEENAAMFFGRDRERTVLISNLRAARLTLLYAPSGAGKSSLLRAGVASKLTEIAQRNLRQRGAARNIPVVFSSWRDDPLAELIDKIQAASLPFLRGAPPPRLAPGRLDEAIEAASLATDATLLVILDQFEEYFVYRSREVRNRSFADELADCVRRVGLRANFLIAIREDAYSGLGDLFKGRISNVYGNYFHLEHLTREAAREAIEKPIAAFNELHSEEPPVEIEPDLVDAVLGQLRPDQFASDQGGVGRLADGNGTRDHRDEVAAPYLQLVMERLWDTEREQRSRKLRVRTLEELGGAQTIVRTHVDRALGDLSDDDRETAVDVLHHLVTPSGTKIALAASDLAEYTSRSAGELGTLLERLARSDTRILRPVQPPQGRTDGTRFEISHDLLAPAILDWGRRRRAARLEREKEAAERQVQTERRRARIFRALAIGSAALLIGATVLAVVAGTAEQSAQKARNDAQSAEMAAEAMNLLPNNVPLAMLLSLQAYERAHTVQAESAVIQASQQPLDELLVSGTETVDGVAFSPDGKTLAVGDFGGQIGLWDVATGRRTAVLAEGSGTVYGVAFSPDGKTLAAGDYGGQVSLWDVATGRRTATLNEGSPVYGVAFSPDGKTLAAGDGGGRVGLWDVATGRRTAVLAEGSPVRGVAFSPDGKTLAAGDFGGQVGLWDVATGRRTAVLAEGSGTVYGVAFSPDGKTLAAGDYGGQVGLWDVATGRRTAVLAEGSGTVYGVAFSPDGKTLAAGDYGGRVGLWDVATGRRTAVLAEGSPVRGVAFSPDGKTLAAGDSGGRVGLWDVATGRVAALAEDSGTLYRVAFSPDGKTLAAGDYGGQVSLWDVATGRRTATLNEGSPVYGVAFSPDGKTLAAGDGGGRVGLWDVATGRRTATLNEGSPVGGIAFSPDGKTLAVGEGAGRVGLWNVATGRRTATLNEGSPVRGIAFSPDGKTLAVGDGAGRVGLWNVATGRRTAVLPEGSSVGGVAFSPDGKTLAVGDGGGRVGLWDVATGRRTATLNEGSPVLSVAFSPDGKTFVTGDSVGGVGVWNAANWQQFADLTESGAVSSLTFAPHDQVLAIASLNGNIVLLRQNLTNLTPLLFTHLICDKVRVEMTQAQWEKYAPGQPYQETCPLWGSGVVALLQSISTPRSASPAGPSSPSAKPTANLTCRPRIGLRALPADGREARRRRSTAASAARPALMRPERFRLRGVAGAVMAGNVPRVGGRRFCAGRRVYR